MPIEFIERPNLNYYKQNIIDLLWIIPYNNYQNRTIYSYVRSPYHTIQVDGHIHRTQFITDNIYNNFWFSISIRVTKTNEIITEFSKAHIYVCFRMFLYKNKYEKILSPYTQCMNPVSLPNGIANVYDLDGIWDFVSVSFPYKKHIQEKLWKKGEHRIVIDDHKTKPITK